MKIKGENNNEETKLLEEKRNEMNSLIGLNNISIKEKITLLINDWCAEHIKTLHKEYPNTEWLAVCKVEPQWNGIFLMTDMVFPWQKGIGWEVETTKQWMEWLTRELADRWERQKEWNCILHSHHHMGVFWSWTDDNARLGMNDWRQVEWAVVTAYNGDEIDYKGCVNFYKPYNIEIDVDVRNVEWESIVEKYDNYLQKVKESEGKFYDYLLDENKEYIDSITDKPSYSRVLDYLWIDITEELNTNYEWIKDKIGNPELVEYMKQLGQKAYELAVSEVNTGGVYTDMLCEYGEFCNWSDNLLTQLENHREKEYSIINNTSPSLFSQTSYPLNRDFDDEYEEYGDYYFTSPDYDELYVRHAFNIDSSIPMKLWKNNEWLVWVGWTTGDYLYVEEWAEEFWG